MGTTRRGVCVAFGLVLGFFGSGATVSQGPDDDAANARPHIGVVMGISFPKAYAIGSRRAWRKAQREIAAKARQEAEQKNYDDREKRLEGTKTTEMPANCVYDSYASTASSSELYLCNGKYYQSYDENGVKGFVAHPVDMNREDVKNAMAREAKREEETRKEQAANKVDKLPEDCTYNSYASGLRATDVFSCGKTLYRQYEENGVTGYEAIKP